jgi:hypothetical protein
MSDDPGSSKDDSPRSRTPSPSNSLSDQLLSTRYLTLPPRISRDRSQLPRRTPQEQREFLASVIREALSIIGNDFDDEDVDVDDSAYDGGKSGGVSGNSNDYGDEKQ